MTGFPILSIVKNITLAQEVTIYSFSISFKIQIFYLHFLNIQVVNLDSVFARNQERLFLTLPRVNVMALKMFQDGM